MSGFLGMFGKKSEVPAPPSGMKPPAPRPPGVGTPPPIADFPSSIMGLKAPKPIGNKIAKSTQRIVLPAQKTGPLLAPSLGTAPIGTVNKLEPTMRIMVPGKIEGAAKEIKKEFNLSTSSSNSTSNFNSNPIRLPLSIALRSLPPAVLSEAFEGQLNPNEEFSIPVDLLVPQLSVGKIEFTVRQMIDFLPPTIFKPSETITAYMETKVVLPMMEVFTRISAQKNSDKGGAITPVEPVVEDQNKTRPLSIPFVPPPVPTAAPAPLIAPYKATATQAPVVENKLEDLLAAAQSALGDEVIGEKTVENPPSIEKSLIEEEKSEVIPPVVVSNSDSVSQTNEPPLEILLKAAQAALEEVPVGDQTVVVPELQEDKVIPLESVLVDVTPEEKELPEAISAPVPVMEPPVESPVKSEVPKNEGNPIELDLNRCDEACLIKEVRCSPEMAKSIVHYRQQSGGFSKIESLLLVPGMTDRVYRSITGQHASVGALVGLNELLNISLDLKITEEQVVARIALWPGIRGCFVNKGGATIGSLVGVEAIEPFVAHATDCLNASQELISSSAEVQQIILKDSIGSWILLRRGKTLLISGFLGGMIPDSMRVVLERLTIELHDFSQS